MRYDKMDHEGRGSVPYTQPGMMSQFHAKSRTAKGTNWQTRSKMLSRLGVFSNKTCGWEKVGR